MTATAIGAGTVAAPKMGRFAKLYYGQTRIDFVRRRRLWFTISGLIILAGVISLATQGLNYGIDFVGGTSWQLKSDGVSVTAVRNALSPYGLSGATITVLGSGSKAQIQVEAKLNNGKGAVSTSATNDVAVALGKLTHQPASNVSIETVGPTWGSQVTHKAIEALIVFLVMISIYISVAFEWRMAFAAIVAVLHDVIVTVGIYSILQFVVTPDTVVAFLTVLGYSLYDTIVVFDRVRDNTRGLGATGKLSYTDVVNLSMNQTLARSINTSLVAIIPVLSVLVLGAYFLGATTLQYFGLALFIGLTSGAYSSIFIASPIVAMLKEREPRYAEIRRRLEARGKETQLISASDYAAGALDDKAEKTSSRRAKKKAAAAKPTGPIRPGAKQTAVAATAVVDPADEPGADFGDEYEDEDEEAYESPNEAEEMPEAPVVEEVATAAAVVAVTQSSRNGGSARSSSSQPRPSNQTSRSQAHRPKKKRKR